MLSRWILATILGAALLLGSPAARSEANVPRQLQDIGIDDRRGVTLPRDVKLTDERGRARTLGDYLGDGRPLVVVLAYYQCPMLCSVVLHRVSEQLRGLAWTAGKEFRVLTVSFDPRDDAARARAAYDRYAAEYGRLAGDDGWSFAVGAEPEVRRLADALGFHYRWDEKSGQYAHAAGAFVVTPDGRLSRTLYGISFTSSDLRIALTEASEGKLGTVVDKALLFCFHYDPNAGSYVIASTRLMRAAGALCVLALALWLRALWRRDRRPPAPALAASSGTEPESPQAEKALS